MDTQGTINFMRCIRQVSVEAPTHCLKSAKNIFVECGNEWRRGRMGVRVCKSHGGNHQIMQFSVGRQLLD